MIIQKYLELYGDIVQMNWPQILMVQLLILLQLVLAISDSFKIEGKITGETGNGGTKSFKIMVPLKDLSNFLGTREMPLIHLEINLDLNWSKKCVTVAKDVDNQGATFTITDAKLYVPVVTFSTQDNAKLL